jgi:type I restriction enzyme S subunit
MCELTNGGTPKTGVAEFWGGQHQWVTPAEMGKRPTPYIDATERKLTDSGLASCSASPLPPHSVILSSRAPIGHLVINTVPMSFNQGCKGLVPKPGLDYKFLYYFLLANVELLNALGTGATFKELSGGKLKEVALPVPPLAEQKRIVALLDEAFEGIAKATANAERNLANARELLAVIRQERFMALRDLAPTSTLGEICKFENGDRGANYPGKQHRVSEGVPFINAGHLSEAGIDFSEMDYISPERFSLLGNGKIRPNDVLFCLRGSLGKFACVNELDKGAIASSLVILRPSERLNLAYLLEYLAGPICAAMIAKYKGGAAQPNLGAKDLKKFEIPLPAHDIQRSTAEELSSFAAQTRDVETAYRAKIAGCMELRQSLLRKAFSGQLTDKEAVAA